MKAVDYIHYEELVKWLMLDSRTREQAEEELSTAVISVNSPYLSILYDNGKVDVVQIIIHQIS